MKTISICVLFMLAGFTAMAQDETTDSFKPSKNNFSVEVNFRPFSAEAPISIDGFRGRLFLNDKFAIRLGCNFERKKSYQETPVDYNNTTYYNSDDQKYMVLGLNSGFEYHFLKSKRFSPYAGFVVGYENKTSDAVYETVEPDYVSGSYTYKVVTTEFKNAWYYGYGSTGSILERGYSQVSCNAVLGADVYLMKHLYMGLELGFGYFAIFYKEVEKTVDGTLEMKFPKAKECNLGINVENSIRLGFWF